jgi:hypothetical protein
MAQERFPTNALGSGAISGELETAVKGKDER